MWMSRHHVPSRWDANAAAIVRRTKAIRNERSMRSTCCYNAIVVTQTRKRLTTERTCVAPKRHPRAFGRASMGVVPADQAERDCAAASFPRTDSRFCDTAGWKAGAATALVAWSVFAMLAATARAEPQTWVALEYEIAPDTEGCPAPEEFQSSVKRQLRYDPFRRGADRRVAVHIARKDKGFEGLIKWSDARGNWVGDRRLASQRPECSEIAANVAFAVAVQIQLLAALEPKSSTPKSSTPKGSAANASPTAPVTSAPPVTAPPEPQTPDKSPTSSSQSNAPTASPASQPPQPRRARLRFSAGLGPSLGAGIAPHLTVLGRGFASVRLDPLSFELAFDAALPASRTEMDGGGFSLRRFGGAAAACSHVQLFAACLTATLGRIEAHGFGVDKPASPAGLFSQLGARIAATHEFGERYFASARIEGLVMLSSWTVTLNDSVAWKTPRISGLVGLDFGVFF
jgi:hypothetical protein